MDCALLVLPGTGFDGEFGIRCFTTLAEYLDIDIFAVTPDPCHHISSLRASIDFYLAQYHLIIAGLSISAAVAVDYFLDTYISSISRSSADDASGSSSDQSAVRGKSGKILAIVAAIPGWSAEDVIIDSNHNNHEEKIPGKLSAITLANSINDIGVLATIAQMRETTPQWLGEHLSRSWQTFGSDLTTLCLQTANYQGPSLVQLQSITIPVIVVGLEDDPIHPAIVAKNWAKNAPQGYYCSTTLSLLAEDEGIFGQLVAQALESKFPTLLSDTR